jgi:hypothetical protein
MPLGITKNGYAANLLGLTSLFNRSLKIVMNQLEIKRDYILRECFRTTLLLGAHWSFNDLWRYYFSVTHHHEAPRYQHKAELISHGFLDEGYPDLEKLLDYRLDEPGSERNIKSSQKVATMLKKIQSIRTDMDHFYRDEREIVETIGYTLAAYRMRMFMSYKQQKQFNSFHEPIYDKWLQKG